MMTDDVNTLDILKNNAKTIGGVIGAEMEFFDKEPKETYFISKTELDL
jgi:hypothetical protein